MTNNKYLVIVCMLHCLTFNLLEALLLLLDCFRAELEDHLFVVFLPIHLVGDHPSLPIVVLEVPLVGLVLQWVRLRLLQHIVATVLNLVHLRIRVEHYLLPCPFRQVKHRFTFAPIQVVGVSYQHLVFC